MACALGMKCVTNEITLPPLMAAHLLVGVGAKVAPVLSLLFVVGMLVAVCWPWRGRQIHIPIYVYIYIYFHKYISACVYSAAWQVYAKMRLLKLSAYFHFENFVGVLAHVPRMIFYYFSAKNECCPSTTTNWATNNWRSWWCWWR